MGNPTKENLSSSVNVVWSSLYNYTLIGKIIYKFTFKN